MEELEQRSQEHNQAAKAHLVLLMQTGYPWHEAAAITGRADQSITHVLLTSLPFLVACWCSPFCLWALLDSTVSGICAATLVMHSDCSVAAHRAYGYLYTERLLSAVARAQGDEVFTDALARWTIQLWHVPGQKPFNQLAPFYVDGHRKPVYTGALIPRGLVGRLSTVLGCRALVLLHDEHGHPLFATTHRGDQHLTIGLPAIMKRYEEHMNTGAIQQIIVDREGMAAEFLAKLVKEGRTVTSILRTDQYTGIGSFTDIGDFIPLCVSKEGTVLREVAPASFA